MRKCTTLTRVAALGLATAAILVPAANASPYEPAYPTPGDTRQASIVPQTGTAQDLRGEAAAGRSQPSVRPTLETPAPVAPRLAPVPTTAGGGSDDGVPPVLIAIASALALGGVMAFTTTRLRPRPHATR